jgi:adenosylcobinamide kinase/adenosylcobinamide-phosphate guanylyltransferase
MIVMVIGGTRSGKSEVAESMARELGEPVTVIVPAVVVDDEHAVRIDVHRRRRPDSWPTVECGARLVEAVEGAEGTVLIDSLGTWVTVTPGLEVESARLVAALRGRAASTVLVTEEVGLSVHPTSDAGRQFVDTLGALNVEIARCADDVHLVVAGRTLRLEP